MKASQTDTPQTPQPRSLQQALRQRSLTWVQETWSRTLIAARRIPGKARTRSANLIRMVAAKDPARVLKLVRLLRRVYPRGAGFAQAEAVLTARVRGWREARQMFLGGPARKTPGAGAAVLRLRPAPALEPALPAQGRHSGLDADLAAKTVIYTAVFGDAPPPAAILYDLPGLRFLCLTDGSAPEVQGWQNVTVAPGDIDPAAGPEAALAWCQIFAHKALAQAAPDAEHSLWLAPGARVVGNVQTLLSRWCAPHDLVLWRHGAGIDWQDLSEHFLISAQHAPEAILSQAEDCAARGLPLNQGAWDAGMIWRRHGSAEVAALMEAWGAALAPEAAPETALYAALNDPAAPPAIRPRILPAALGRAEDNIFTARIPVPRIAKASPTVAISGGKRAVSVVYAEEYAQSASTFLRGRQLSELVAARQADRLDVSYTSDISGLRDQVVVLTKGALEIHSAEQISELRKRNIAVIGSWDDAMPVAGKVAATSGSMTLSHRQTVDFAHMFPDSPVFHVTHHVNTQIRPSTPPEDRLRTGYFGFVRNTWRPDSLGNMIDLVPISTAKVEMNWIDTLPNYNCHWSVRRRGKAHDGWKPFLKGFVAARCNAVVAIGRDDDDAMQYLGDDYPFFVRGPNPDLLEYDLYRIAAAFGGPEWHLAREIMAQVEARSTDAVVVAEFLAMVDEVSR